MNMRATTLLLSALLLTQTSCGVGSAPDQTSNTVAVSDNIAVAAGRLRPCRVTGTRLTEEDCADAQYWLDQSRRGNASFKAPAKMRQGETTFVTLALGTAPVPPPTPTPTPTPVASPGPVTGNETTPEDGSPAGNETAAIRPLPGDRTPHDLAEDGGGTGRTVDYHPFVGQKMKATLEGAGFEVKPLSPEIQTVTEGSNAIWRWSVTARSRGDLSLILRTTVVMIDSQGNAQELRPTVEPQPIHVSIGASTIWNWLTDLPNWLKALTTILVAAAALVAAWKGLRASVLGSKTPPAAAAGDETPKPPDP
ncbi:MAG: hypothetical protein WC729_03615 [Sphingomonas sp.]|jgi:hypothetical protein|uniref:hypothetical protein n=1 Tax=Sphingomonas sp. TaxID=28214 RepID=UPI00356583BD